MNFICAANWKMNLSYIQAKIFLLDFHKQVLDLGLAADFVNSNKSSNAKASSNSLETSILKKLKSPFLFFPQATHVSLFQNNSILNWGAQDFYFESQGAFTGQNSPDIFKELGANVMLIGHSERRSLFAETESMIEKKIKKCEDLDLIPVLCVGETFEQKQAGQTLDVLRGQLKSAFNQKPKNLILAYEPVWAIGTGLVASVDDVSQVHSFLKEVLGAETPILYGGSVKPENAKELASLNDVNGFLIGGASLKVDSLLAIYKKSIEN